MHFLSTDVPTPTPCTGSQVQRMDVDCNLSNERFVTMKNDMAAQYADLYFGSFPSSPQTRLWKPQHTTESAVSKN